MGLVAGRGELIPFRRAIVAACSGSLFLVKMNSIVRAAMVQQPVSYCSMSSSVSVGWEVLRGLVAAEVRSTSRW